jgi:hypothetical protein
MIDTASMAFNVRVRTLSSPLEDMMEFGKMFAAFKR